MLINNQLKVQIQHDVAVALAEDLGSGDLTSLLISEQADARGQVCAEQESVLCGTLWFDAAFQMLDPDCSIVWHAQDGDVVRAGQVLCEVFANARALLSAERSALNFLQLLSGTATTVRVFVEAVKNTQAQIADTRKTLPGLRYAQKYAVRVGGGINHRMGLYDGVLIKQNHICAAGGIAQALKKAHKVVSAGAFVGIQVDTLEAAQEAIKHGAKVILLENMTSDMLREVVKSAAGQAKIEVSCGAMMQRVCELAQIGVDRISIAGLTNEAIAIDFSLRHVEK